MIFLNLGLRFSLFGAVILIIGQLVALSAPLAITSSGLELTVPAFRIDAVEFPGGTIKALSANDQYLVLNLKTLTLHTLGRNISDGEMALARIRTSETEVVSIDTLELEVPETRIPAFLQKLKQGEKTTVRCFGTSLVENGGQQTGWLGLLFDQKNQEKSFLVESILPIKWLNHAVGGSNARYTAALLGTGKSGDVTFATPAYDCDLAIVGLLPNGGKDRLAVYEGVVRLLRKKGVEVLLVTDNAYSGAGEEDALWKDGEFVRSMADHYGCALADTAAYMMEAERRGEQPYSDAIHQSPEGHRCWAKAVSGVLSATPTSYLSENRGNQSSTLEDFALIPQRMEVDFLSGSYGGKQPVHSKGNRIAAFYGHEKNSCWQFDAGETLVVQQPGMLAADLVVDAASGFSMEIRREGETSAWKIIDYKAPEGAPTWAVRPITQTILSCGESDDECSGPYQLVITKGALRLYGIAYRMQ